MGMGKGEQSWSVVCEERRNCPVGMWNLVLVPDTP